MKLLAGLVAAALANDWGYYYDDDAYYGGKSQASQTMFSSTPYTSYLASNQGLMGNGRICWHCSERNYGDCLIKDLAEWKTGGSGTVLGSTQIGDAKRHGAAYCLGEDYFCFITERRIIRHTGNDENHYLYQPWSPNGGGTVPDMTESNGDFNTANKDANTYIKVEMGCQQPQACLRQQNMNYKINMGASFYGTTVPLAFVPVAGYNPVREGLCRLGADWVDYASGKYSGDAWRQGQWSSATYDRRYGAVDHHYHFGKGTESVCHYCCDPLQEFTSVTGSDGLLHYGYLGCNYHAVASGKANIGDTNVDETVSDNVFIKRQHNWKSPVWNHASQYHGMFRNPHTNKARQLHTDNNSGAHPNA